MYYFANLCNVLHIGWNICQYKSLGNHVLTITAVYVRRDWWTVYVDTDIDLQKNKWMEKMYGPINVVCSWCKLSWIPFAWNWIRYIETDSMMRSQNIHTAPTWWKNSCCLHGLFTCCKCCADYYQLCCDLGVPMFIHAMQSFMSCDCSNMFGCSWNHRMSEHRCSTACDSDYRDLLAFSYISHNGIYICSYDHCICFVYCDSYLCTDYW